MLDLKFIRENLALVKSRLSQRSQELDVDQLVQADQKRRELIQEVETLRGERNTVSEKIARLKKQKEDASAEIAQMKSVSQNIKALDAQKAQIEEQVRASLLQIPNIPHESVVAGKDDSQHHSLPWQALHRIWRRYE